MRPERALYRTSHYGSYNYHPLRNRRGMTADEAVANAGKLRVTLQTGGFTLSTITVWGLDNPFMSDDARAVMTNMARQFKDVRRESRAA